MCFFLDVPELKLLVIANQNWVAIAIFTFSELQGAL